MINEIKSISSPKSQLGHAIVINCKIINSLLSPKEMKNFTYMPVFVVWVPYNNAS